MNQPTKKYFLFIFLFALFVKAFSGNVKTPEPQNTVKFTENKNQWDKKIKFCAQLDGGELYLEKNCFTYNFYDKETVRNNHVGNNKPTNESSLKIRTHAFRMTFENALPSVEIAAKQATHDYNNYFLGNDKNKWVGNVKNYKEVNYKNLYQGIDLQIIGMQNSLKYNFIVAPMANTNEIKLFYQRLKNISIEKGALKLTTSINEMVEQRPFAYQWIEGKRVQVPCEFVLENTTVRFNFPKGYEKTKELIIDPVLVFACSSGSLADNFGMTATYDAQGNLYSGGTVFGIGYPTTAGAFDVTWNGSSTYEYGRTDVVITKYDSSGIFLQYSTYIGGFTGTEIVTSLVVDASNNLLLYGATGSTDFPTTANAYDNTFNGGVPMYFYRNGTYFYDGTDIYLAKLNSTGTALLASTYIGGSLNDGVNYNNDSIFLFNFTDPVTSVTYPVYESQYDSLQFNYGDQYRGEINVDKYGNAYISSSSRSSNFPIVNGFDNTFSGKQDAVVMKLNSDFSQIIWSTYLGGSDNDAGYALALDDSLNVYVTGGTRSMDFPTTPLAFQTTYNGGKADGYIAKVKNDGTSIIEATYWGTSTYDQTYFVQLDKDENVFVVGQTDGAMPVTTSVYNNPNSGQFITKFDNSLGIIIFSTVFGNGNGKPNISPSAFLVDYCGNIYVAGWGGNILTGPPTIGMPLTSNAYQSTNPDGYNFYLFVLSIDASSLIYASYFGGAQSQEHVDGGTSRFDKKGIIYESVCAGCGGFDDFPVTVGSWPYTSPNYIPYDPSNPYPTGINMDTQKDNCNNGVFKMDFQVPLAQANFTVNNISGCAPLLVTFQNQSTTGGSYLWDFGNNDTISTQLNPTKIYTTPGTYLVRLFVNDPSRCNVADTAYQYITVYPPITADFNFIPTPCSNQVAFYDSSAVAPVSWLWNFGDNDTSTFQNPSHTYASAGNYDATLIVSTANGCKDTTQLPIDYLGNVSVNPSDSICLESDGAQLFATGGIAYQWIPSSSLNASNISNPIAHPSITTTYTVNITTVNGVDTCVRTLTTTVFVFSSVVYSVSATVDKDTLVKGQSTTLHAIADTTLTVLWNPADGLDNPNSFNPIATPTKTTTYTLSIVGAGGCQKIVTVTIYVISMECNEGDVFVPNTFTPNDDGKNDVLYVRSNSIMELYFAVYNRWGQMVFETNDIKKGWDGIYNGMKADPAVFAWYLKAKCYNGNQIFKKGNTTIIR